MYIREKKNSSGSASIQVVSKRKGRHKVVKTIGYATMLHEIEELKMPARREKIMLEAQPSLFPSEQDDIVEQIFSTQGEPIRL